MSILRTTPNYSNRTIFSSTDRAVQALRRTLDELNYSPLISRDICIRAHTEHHLAGLVESGHIDPADLDALTEALVNGFDEVHPSSPQWNDRSTWSADPAPTPLDSALFAELDGSYDIETGLEILTAPLDDQPVDDDRWLEYSLWAAMTDPTSAPDVEEAEIAECRISRR